MQKQYKGQMTRDEEKELDRKLGNFYSITLCGKTHKINNCATGKIIVNFKKFPKWGWDINVKYRHLLMRPTALCMRLST